MNKSKFYGNIRNALFRGRLTQAQVDGMENLFSAASDASIQLRAQIAYILATVYHETGATFVPVVENLNYSEAALLRTFPKYFSPSQAKQYARKPQAIANRAYANRMDNGDEKSGDGWRYRGRGYPQLTGQRNYRIFSKLVNLDLVKEPDAALNPGVSAKITAIGMRDGLFTGKNLSNFIKLDKVDFVHARQIINGMDRAEDIAGYAETFDRVLREAA